MVQGYTYKSNYVVVKTKHAQIISYFIFKVQMQSFEMFRLSFLLFLDLIPLSSKHTLPQTPDATNLAKVHIKGQHAGNQNSFHTNTNTQVQKYKYTIIQTQIQIQTHKS